VRCLCKLRPEPLKAAVDWIEFFRRFWGTSLDTKALDSYKTVFGYGHDTMDMGPQGTYYLLTQGGKPRSGLMRPDQGGAPTMWPPWVLVADCDRTLALARRLGAQELLGAPDIPKVGRFAIFADPTGAAIAFMNKA
jgi:hypothetical protein